MLDGGAVKTKRRVDRHGRGPFAAGTIEHETGVGEDSLAERTLPWLRRQPNDLQSGDSNGLARRGSANRPQCSILTPFQTTRFGGVK